MDPRPYVRMSTDLPLNPKLAAIDDPAASWAYVVSICYAGQTLSDGHVPVVAVLRLAGVDKAVATALAEQELWHLPSHTCSRCPQPKPGHAYIHDYLQHQRSADEVRDLTSKRREAGRKGAAKRWAASKNVAADLPGEAPAGSKPIANAMANAQQELWQMDGKPIAEERRGEKNKVKPSRASAGADDATKSFAEFWAVYPKRKAKAAAERAYRTALKKVTAERLLAAATSYRDDSARQRNDAKFTKYPATWLNGGCWDDEPDQPSGINRHERLPWDN